MGYGVLVCRVIFLSSDCPRSRGQSGWVRQYDCIHQVNENQKRILKNISKLAAYTAMTGGAYFLARGALSLLLKHLETKVKSHPKVLNEKAEPASIPSPKITIENSSIRSATP